MEDVVLLVFERIIVLTAVSGTVVSSNPDPVAGCRVRNTVVIYACGNEYCRRAIADHVARSERTVSILRNLVLEVVIETRRCIAGACERALCRNQRSISGSIRIEKHLITAAIAPYVISLERYCCISVGNVNNISAACALLNNLNLIDSEEHLIRAVVVAERKSNLLSRILRKAELLLCIIEVRYVLIHERRCKVACLSFL